MQSLSLAMKEMLWIRNIMLEVLHQVDVADCDEYSKLLKTVACIDAKSAYDNATSVAVHNMHDRESALDMIITKRLRSRLGCSLRWVPRVLMVADGLTKDDGPAADKIRLHMASGLYLIGKESDAIARSKAEKERRVARGKARDAANKKTEADKEIDRRLPK